ncbi:MAG: EB domain-containing protein [Myxococcota bacterium]
MRIPVCAFVVTLGALLSCSSGESSGPAEPEIPDTPDAVSDDDPDIDREPDQQEDPGPPLGSACTRDAECGDEATCVEGVCCNAPCDGVCRSCLGDISGGFDGECTFLAAGDEFVVEEADYEDCPGIARCDGEGRCFDKQQGEACGADYECRSEICTDGACCDDRCDGACRSCESGTCLPIDEGADPGLCDACLNGGVCELKDAGEGCELPEECGSEICTDGTCRLPDLSTCSVNTQCGEVCVGGQCRSLRAPGQSCDSGEVEDCEPGLSCIGGNCVIPSGASRECEVANECQDPFCINDQCLPPADAGGACEATEQCTDSDNLLCRDGRCIDATGETCENGTCPGARACDGTRCYSTDPALEVEVVAVALRISRGEPGDFRATLSCLNSDGFRQETSVLSTTKTESSDAINCAAGSVVSTDCDYPLSGEWWLTEEYCRSSEVPASRGPLIGSCVEPRYSMVAERSGEMICSLEWFPDF